MGDFCGNLVGRHARKVYFDIFLNFYILIYKRIGNRSQLRRLV